MLSFSVMDSVRASLRGIKRKVVLSICVVSVLASSNSALITDAKAQMPMINSFEAFLPKYWGESRNFDPHYGSVIPWPFSPWSPIPIPSRKWWCLPSVKVVFVCVPPIPNNWCDQTTQCVLTNILNRMSVFEIRHAKVEGERYVDPIESRNADTDDFTMRDRCVMGAKPDYKKFDDRTGKLKATGMAQYDESATGYVIGSKPLYGNCMNTFSNPRVVSSTTGFSAFTNYIKSSNQFPKISGTASGAKDFYGRSDTYTDVTFFIGGVFGCPANFLPKPIAPATVVTASQWKSAANRCYNLYIANRSTHPEWTLERAGPATEDPLTRDDDPSTPQIEGDPYVAIFNSCQPLMSGTNAAAVATGASPVGLGFAPVLSYKNRPDLDEADYSMAEALKKQYQLAFPHLSLPAGGFSDYFPCWKQEVDNGEITRVQWKRFNTTLRVFYTLTATIEAWPIGNYEGPVLFRGVPLEYNYISPSVGKTGYCPNVEKVIAATNPFAPRDDIKPKPSNNALIQSVLNFNNAFNSNYADETKIYSTDRQYSYQTAFLLPEDRILGGFKWSYEDWADVNNPAHLGLYTASGNAPTPTKLRDFAKHPSVQCAIVPVDILESRREAFNSCIMQRITWNYLQYRRYNFLTYYHTDQYIGKYAGHAQDLIWKGPPCKTRFYEDDNVVDCPVSMSIKQCCRILVKDVVPVNHLKMRTCEGLRQKRRLVLDISHIYDGQKWKIDYIVDTAKRDAAYKLMIARLNVLNGKVCQFGTFGDDVYANFTICPALLNIVKKNDITITLPISNVNPTGGTIKVKAVSEAAIDYCYALPASTWKANNGLTCSKEFKNWVKPYLDARKLYIREAKGIPKITYTPVVNEGGKFMSVTDRNSYNNAYDENLKLTLLGCDNTEPSDYRFDHYFGVSDFSKVPTLSAGIGTLNNAVAQMGTTIYTVQYNAYNLFLNARDMINQGIVTTVGWAWNIFDSGKAQITAPLDYASNFLRIVVQEKIRATREYDDMVELNKRYTTIGTVEQAMFVLGWNNYTLADLATKTAQKFAESQGYSLAIGPLSQTENNVRTAVESAFITAENVVRDNVQQTIDLAATKIEDINNKTNQAMADLVSTQTKPHIQKINGAISTVINSITSNPVTDGLVAQAEIGGAHMPYMRRWDTGSSAGNVVRGGSFINTLGSYDTIIGVGREERDYFDATTPSGNTRIAKKFKGLQPFMHKAQMGRVEGWNALKGYQASSVRKFGLNCVARYEKTFKKGSQEDYVLHRAGAGYYTQKGGAMLNQAGVEGEGGILQTWPLGWRGYVNDPFNEFEANITATGLDNAKVGDFIIFKINGWKNIAYVESINFPETAAGKTYISVKISSRDTGRFPTVAGASTVSWGQINEREIYKNKVPDNDLFLNTPTGLVDINTLTMSSNGSVLNQVARINGQPSCSDPSFRSCVLGDLAPKAVVDTDKWNDVKIYRPSGDTDHRQCPMLDYDPTNPELDTRKITTSSFSYCVNAGYDPPPRYVLNNFKGAGAGLRTDVTLCGPSWNQCDAYVPSSSPTTSSANSIINKKTTVPSRCFPGNVPCN